MSTRAPDGGVREPGADPRTSARPETSAAPTPVDAPAPPGAPAPGVGVSPHGAADAADDAVPWREFALRRDGMLHAMDGGLWLHRHVWKGTPMAHLVSTDRAALLAYGATAGLPPERLQYKPLKDPRTHVRRPAWHWDLVGSWLPPART